MLQFLYGLTWRNCYQCLRKIHRLFVFQKFISLLLVFAPVMKQRSVLSLINALPLFSLCMFSTYFCSGISSFILDGLFILFLFLILLVLFHSLQDYLLYHPEQPQDSRICVRSPSLFGLSFESLTIATSDGTQIHAFLVKAEGDYSQRPTMIMFHGNAGNIGHRLENAQLLVQQCNFNVVLMEYRGYGLSGGEISEQGLYDDAVSTVNYIKTRKDLNPRLIMLHGRSLGGAVAIYVASQPENSDILALMLENTFTSLPDIAKHVLNISLVKKIPSWCYKNQYPSIERITQISLPTLFLSGLCDTLVPPTHMERLAMASGSIKKQVGLFRMGTHNDTWAQHGYCYKISQFVEQLL